MNFFFKKLLTNFKKYAIIYTERKREENKMARRIYGNCAREASERYGKYYGVAKCADVMRIADEMLAARERGEQFKVINEKENGGNAR